MTAVSQPGRPAARPRSLRRPILLAIFLGLALLVALAALKGVRIYGYLSSAKGHLDAIEAVAGGGKKNAALGADTFRRLRDEFKGGRADFLALQAEVAPFLPLAERLHGLPVVGGSLEATPHLLAMGDHLLGAADVMLDSLDPLLNTALGGEGGGKGSITERVLTPLIAAQPALVQAQELIDQAAAERAKIDSWRLLSPLARQVDRLDKYLPTLQAGAQGAIVAPNILGAVRPRTYLLLAQNNDELRPTGGFITAVGILTLDKGKIARLEFKDSYQIDNWQWDHPAAPAPLLRHMDAQLWVFRDTNFWPDFGTSARAAQEFAARDLQMEVDGIIAVDQQALQILVGGLGSVTVPEYDNDVVTGENAIEKIRSYWAPPGGDVKTKGWWRQRKDFMNLLVEAMQTKLETQAKSINMARFAKSVLRVLNEKHVLIYLREPLGSGFARQANWDGTMAATQGDYLAVVDTNMGFNKASAIMEQSINYEVSINQQGMAQAQVDITYKNTSNRSVECIHEPIYEGSYDLMMNRCFWDYLRIYTPQGATAIADENGNDLERAPAEAGKQVFASWRVIGAGEEQRVAFGYYLPQPVLAPLAGGRQYTLTVQKQAGTLATPLRVTVRLPAGALVQAAQPAPAVISGNTVTFETRLDTDKTFTVIVRPVQ